MIGILFNGRYQLEAEIGQGGTRTVYRAHDSLLERDVAVKVLSGASIGSEGRTRLLQVIRQVCVALEHAHPHGRIHRGSTPKNVIIYFLQSLDLAENWETLATWEVVSGHPPGSVAIKEPRR